MTLTEYLDRTCTERGCDRPAYHSSNGRDVCNAHIGTAVVFALND